MLSRELKAGIVVLLAGVVLYFGISYLKNSSLFDKGITVYSVYERVDGLMGSQPVTINGFAVGRIESIGFHPDQSGRLVVAMRLDTDYPIPVTSLALIKSSDLLGAKEISLQVGEGVVLVEDGDTLRSAIEESLGDAINKEVLPVKVKTEKLIASLDTAVQILTGFLQGGVERDFRSSFSNVNQSLIHLNEITTELSTYMTQNRESLGRATQNFERLSKSLSDNRDELERVFANVANISDSLGKANVGQTMLALERTSHNLDVVTGRMANGEGTLGKLSAQDSLYTQIEKTVQSLDRLLLDLRYHPERYVRLSVFGRRPSRIEEE
ncbi:MAG: MlaD family protein [Bacteroidota bacterium]|jgi:phospholipid/cholesterol/gamma-HCH transport system substrate-binding protein